MRHAYKAFLLLIVLALPLPAHSEQSLSFVTVENFAPYAWLQDGNPTGIDVEIIDDLSQRSGIPVTISLLPAKRLIQMIKTGIAHGGFAAFKTPAREEIADFIETPVHLSTYQIFVKKDAEFDFQSTKDLHGKSIGKNRGFHISEEFSKAEADGKIHIVEVSKMEQNIEMLNKGRLDVFVGNKLEVAYTLRQLGLSNMILPLPVPVRTPQGAHLMISKAAKIDDRRDIIKRLSETLLGMQSDGTLNKIYEKYGK